MLVLFNMLPTFPMDGGRVLRAVLNVKWGLVRATEMAVVIGRGVMVVGLGYLFYQNSRFFASNPMLLVVAAFVFLAGQQELMAIRQREAARHFPPVPLPMPELPLALETLPPNVGPDFSGVTWDARSGVGIQWRDGRPVASFTLPRE